MVECLRRQAFQVSTPCFRIARCSSFAMRRARPSACRVAAIVARTGRSRAYYRKFRLSRIMLRELANKGLIPGVIKSSW